MEQINIFKFQKQLTIYETILKSSFKEPNNYESIKKVLQKEFKINVTYIGYKTYIRHTYIYVIYVYGYIEAKIFFHKFTQN